MRFRQYALSFIDFEIAYGLLAAVCILNIIFSNFYEVVMSMIIILIINIILYLFVKSGYDGYITINETEISCCRTGNELWVYKWEDIAELKKSTVHGHYGIIIYLYDKHGKQEQIPLRHGEFQLGKEAKAAIQKFNLPVSGNFFGEWLISKIRNTHVNGDGSV